LKPVMLNTSIRMGDALQRDLEQRLGLHRVFDTLIATRFTFIERCKLRPFSEDCLQHPSRL